MHCLKRRTSFCSAATNSGGSNGATMRFPAEKGIDANKGLNVAQDLLEPIKAQFPWISYSDLWTLAGAVAIEDMGGAPPACTRHLIEIMRTQCRCESFQCDRRELHRNPPFCIAAPLSALQPPSPVPTTEVGLRKAAVPQAGCVKQCMHPPGPHIPWRPGRPDQQDGSNCPPDGRLPDAAKGAPHIRRAPSPLGAACTQRRLLLMSSSGCQVPNLDCAAAQGYLWAHGLQ